MYQTNFIVHVNRLLELSRRTKFLKCSFSSVVLKRGCAFSEVFSSMQSVMHTPRALIVTDEPESFSKKGTSQEGRLAFELRKVGLDCTTLHAREEEVSWPTAGLVNEGASLAQRIGAGAVIGLGAGKAMDTAKIIARGGIQRPFSRELPVICIPTTCSMGAAKSPEAWIFDDEKEALVKFQGDQNHCPQVLLADPELLETLPFESLVHMALTALGGCVDGLTYWGMTEHAADENIYQLGMSGVKSIAEGLKKAGENPKDLMAREHLLKASLIAGEVTSLCRAPAFKMLCLAWIPYFNPLKFSALGALLAPRILSTLIQSIEERASDGETAAVCTLEALNSAAVALSGQDGTQAEYLHRFSWDTLQLTSAGDLSNLVNGIDKVHLEQKVELMLDECGESLLDCKFNTNDFCDILEGLK